MNNTTNNNNGDIEVYLKHKVISAEWELFHPLFGDLKPCMGLGEYMIRHMESRVIDYNVRRDIEKFNSIDRYYVRKFIKSNAFININYSNMPLSQSIIDTVWRVYNYDPWNRQFPYWLENCESDYYKRLSKYETRVRYGYWVFYHDKVIGCNKNDQNNYTVSIFNKLPRNVIPGCILSSTSVEGVTVACLDIIEA